MATNKSGSGQNRRRATQSIAGLTRISDDEDFGYDPQAFGGTAFRIHDADGRPADLFVGQGRAYMKTMYDPFESD